MIVMLRHGATLPGDNPGLSGEGLSHVRERVKKLKDFPVTAILTDTKRRTNQTAAEWARQIGVPVIKDPRLDNWDLGKHEGDHGPEVDAVVKDLIANPTKQPPEGGETAHEYQTRLFAALQDRIAAPELYGVANHSRGIKTVEVAMAHPNGEVTPEGWADKKLEPEGAVVLVTPKGAERIA